MLLRAFISLLAFVHLFSFVDGVLVAFQNNSEYVIFHKSELEHHGQRNLPFRRVLRESAPFPTIHAAEVVTKASTRYTAPCSAYQWKCKGDGKCIDLSQRCDDYPNCSDSSDEFGCNKCDLSRFFRCHNGECISAFFKCDGHPDCGDSSDELDCRAGKGSSSMCPFGTFKCKSDDLCLPTIWQCDGNADCPDTTDEEDCADASLPPCTEQQYTCHNGFCISHEFVCDGETDCKTGEDEENCEQSRCKKNPNLYQCKDGSCLEPERVCNGQRDCVDGTDEGGHCARACKEEDCSHECYKTPTGPHCKCPEGRQLLAEKYCSDLNECSGNVSVCDHFCENTPGGYKCSCAVDYTLDSDKKTCWSSQYGQGFLLLTMNMEIREVYLNATKYRLLFAGDKLIQSVAYDPVEDEIYWSNSVIVYKKRRNHEMKEILIISTGIQRVESMALDWYGRNLYIVDSGIQKILVCTLDGLSCMVLLEDLPSPRAIQLDIRNRIMFWTDLSRLRIEKASMDGSHRRVLVSTGLGIPNGLAIDQPAKRVYWMDATHSKVEYVDYYGADRKHLPDGSVSHPFSMAIWQNRIYWSDLGHEHIRSCLKISGKGVQTLLKGSSRNDFYGLTLYHSSMLNQGENPCSQRHCSHFCLLSTNSLMRYTCACPVGMELSNDDMHSCRDVAGASFTLIADGKDVYELTNPKIGHPQKVPRMAHFKIERVGDLVYDQLEDSVIVSDTFAKMIVQVSLKNSHVRPIIDNVIAVGLAFDWLRNNIYWVDGQKQIVEVVPTFGLHRKILKAHYYNPTDIAVAPEIGFLFVTDAGYVPFITRCGLDGSDSKKIIQYDLKKPMSITVDRDPKIKRIYWSDMESGTIESADMEGLNRVKLVEGLQRPISFLLSSDYIMWTLEGREYLYKHSRENKATVPYDLDLGPANYGVRVLQLAEVGWKGPTDRKDAPCQQGNGGCSHICLGNNTHRQICECSLGFALAEDGKHCETTSCPKNFFSCPRSNSCVPMSWKCDGTSDCDDGGDEEGCSPQHKICNDKEFKCTSGTCITDRWVCDGHPDCFDGIDENQPQCVNKTCRSGYFECKSGQCVPGMWKCDGQTECEDGSDEEDCPTGCPDHKFACNDGSCIPDVWHCDRGKDCPDGSDEDDCRFTTTEDSGIPDHEYSSTHLCSADDLACDVALDQDLICVSDSKICDGVADCPYGDDEEDCNCEEGQFKCKTNDVCIPDTWKCNRIGDCPDLSDEENCPNIPSAVPTTIMPATTSDSGWNCEIKEYECKNGQCISGNRVCDGAADCDDGSDEWNHCYENCVKDDGGCHQNCRSSVNGVHCSCYRGYHLDKDGSSCLDDLECEEESTRSHYCNEMKGTYFCSCMDGYALEPDRRTCKSEAGKEWLLLAGLGGLINMTDNLHVQSKMLVLEGISVNTIDYDPLDSAFVYADASGSVGKIERKGLTEFGEKVELLHQRTNPHGLSIDTVTRNIYFSEYFVDPRTIEFEDKAKEETIELEDKAKKVKRSETLEEIYSVIQVCSLETKKCAQIYRAFNIKIPSTKVSSEHQKLFYCTNHQNHENQAQIVMTYLDGTLPVVLRETKVVRCGSLAIDEPKKRIYWTDTVLNSIQSVLWTGDGHRTVMEKGVHNPFGLALSGDYIMWFNKNGNRIIRCHKYSGSCERKILASKDGNGTVEVGSLLAVHPYREFENLCKEKNCSHLCTVARMGATCLCYSGYQISEEDPTKCLEVDACPGNPCADGVCELLSSEKFVCRCRKSFSGLRCEVMVGVLTPSSNAGTAAAIVIVLALLVGVALAVCWYKRQPFIIWKSKRHSANQTYRFSNPAFGVMSDSPIVTNSPAPSSCPSQGNNPPPYTMNNPQQTYNSYENPFSKAEEHHQVNTSLDSAVVSGTDSTSVNIAPHHIDLCSPIPQPEYLHKEGKKEYVLSPYNPPPV
uniref:Vitellogenin receptor n=1 Tax=Pandalus japonicus TaxID=666362 RepID=W8PAB1_PANJP|nr:vitellogenin receptor [Pandalus japonicus]